MTRKLLWATLAVAWGIVLAGGQQPANAQNASERKEATSSDTNAASPHQAPANATNSNQETSDGIAANYDEQGRADNEMRNGPNASNRGEPGTEIGNGRQWSNDNRDLNDRQRRSNRNERSGDRGRSRQNARDWHSEIRFGQSTQDGLKIESVEQGAPFYRGGLREGDVIVSYDGRPIQNEGDFARWVIVRPGERVPVVVLREGQRETVYVTYEDRGNQMTSTDSDYAEQGYGAQAFLGLRFEARGRGAAVISSVIPGSSADEAGLRSGDEILALDGRDISSARDVTRTVASMQPGDRVEIDFSRPAENHTQAVLGQRPGAGTNAAYQQWQDQGRNGSQAEGVETSSYNQETINSGSGNYDNGDRAPDRGPERRGSRPLLSRFRD